jgi:hypothetical protein
MHGREEDAKSPVAMAKTRRRRYRLNVELDEEESRALGLELAATGITQKAWMQGVVRASLGKRGFRHAGERLYRDRMIRDRQEFLNGGLSLIGRMRDEPILLPATCSLVEHTLAGLASMAVSDIRATLHRLVRHVAEKKVWYRPTRKTRSPK